MGEGAERVVIQFSNLRLVGDGYHITDRIALVAKETRFIDDELLKYEFHTKFCRTQMKASDLAKKFNEKIVMISKELPKIVFLDCKVYVWYVEELKGDKGVLVEKMLDQSKYKKWNSNDGYVNQG